MKILEAIWTYIHKNPIKSILLIGAIIRILVSVLYQHITIYPDSNDYILLAERLANIDLSGYQGERSPGYPIIIAICNNSLLITTIIQSIAGLVTLVFTYKTGLAANLSKKWSLVTTLFLACYLPCIFYELAILSESLTILLITISIYCLFRIIFQRQNQIANYLSLAIACSCLTLVKPFYIFIPFIYFIILIIYDRKIRGIIMRYSYILLLPLLVYCGWSLVNKINTGYFVPTTFYGYNIAQNCVAFAENTSAEYKRIGDIYADYRDKNIKEGNGTAMSIWEAHNALKAETGLSFTDLSRELYNYSIVTIKLNPKSYIRQVFISWRDFWKTSFYWQPENSAHGQYGLLFAGNAERLVIQLAKIFFVLLIPVSIIQSIRNKKITPQAIISILVITASILQAMVTYGTNSRFSYPFEGLMIISLAISINNYIKSRGLKKS